MIVLTKKYQTGLALIELMIALALSALLMLGITRMFADTLSNSTSETALAEIQESGRIALEMLKRDVRMAGYKGDVPNSSLLAMNSTIDLSVEPVSITSGLGGLSDSLLIRRAFEATKPLDLTDSVAGRGRVLVTDFFDTTNQNSLTLDRAICYDDNDVFLVTDGLLVATFVPKDKAPCISGDSTSSTIRFTPVDNRTENNSISLSGFALHKDCPFIPDSCPVLFQVDADVNSQYNVKFQDSIPALFKGDREIVRGVENFQVLLGIKDSENNTRYQSQCSDEQKTNGNCNITHLRISLLISSTLSVRPQNSAQKYPILNTLVSDSLFEINDRRIRRLFTSTIQLRNQR